MLRGHSREVVLSCAVSNYALKQERLVWPYGKSSSPACRERITRDLLVSILVAEDPAEEVRRVVSLVERRLRYAS